VVVGHGNGEGMMKRALPVLMMGVVLLGVTVSQAAEPLKELRVSAIPDENPNELMRIYTPVAEYLS
jgi:ABC-type phosphate/phosphonate transport system substrate-binding protein